MNRYLALDTETGGIGSDVSLLTTYLAVLDENFETIDALDLRMKPDNGIYQCTAEALGINKINLVEHEKVAITLGKAGELLREFLIKNSENGKIKMIPIGHNVAFDLDKVYQNVLNKKEAQKYVSYRTLDTGPIGRALIIVGKIPESVSGSLGSFADHFKVPKEELHTADGDVRTTVNVLKAMLELMK